MLFISPIEFSRLLLNLIPLGRVCAARWMDCSPHYSIDGVLGTRWFLQYVLGIRIGDDVLCRISRGVLGLDHGLCPQQRCTPNLKDHRICPTGSTAGCSASEYLATPTNMLSLYLSRCVDGGDSRTVSVHIFVSGTAHGV